MSNPKKEAFFQQFSRIGKALSSPKRLEILDLLCQGEKTVETLAKQAGLGVKNASAQLKELKAARLVEVRKVGKYAHYRLASPNVAAFFHSFRAVAESQLAEVHDLAKQFFGEVNMVTPVDRKALLSKAKRGEVIVLDVRPPDEFASAHLPYAVSVPLSELHKQLEKLPKDKEIVAYCRGPYCVLAAEAVELLRKKGFNAVRLDDGVWDWKLAGLRVEEAVSG